MLKRFIHISAKLSVNRSVLLMGRLENGVWVTNPDLAPSTADGSFVRPESSFRGSITADGSSGHKAEPGRYHLYVAYSCPWAHRTILYRSIKGLENVISLSPVEPKSSPNGWAFGCPGDLTADPLYGLQYLHQIYTKGRPDYTGKVTVPVLWDKQLQTVVNNESAEIIRMLNSEFKEFAAGDSPDFYPEDLRTQIDEINAKVYDSVNNGVYKAGFAKSQQAYETNAQIVYDSLNEIDAILANNRYLIGDRLTEADWRLFTTLIRFDSVYAILFRCSRKCLREYANLSRYLKELYRYPGVKETVNFEHIKRHYYNIPLTQTGLIALSPDLDL